MKPTKEMVDTNLIYSRPLKFEIFYSIKAWVALTGGSVVELFKNLDKKGSLFAVKR